MFRELAFDLYMSQVFDYLESLGYPDLVIDFEPKAVAKSLNGAIKDGFNKGLSFRMCSIVIFSLTMNMQVIPSVKAAVKH